MDTSVNTPPVTLTVRMIMQGKEVGSIIGKKVSEKKETHVHVSSDLIGYVHCYCRCSGASLICHRCVLCQWQQTTTEASFRIYKAEGSSYTGRIGKKQQMSIGAVSFILFV